MPYDDWQSDELRKEAGATPAKPSLFYRDGRKLPEDKASRVKPTARADAFTITEASPCSRCGGQGGAQAWKYTGYTCYQCGGRNSMAFHVRQIKLYTAERLAKLQAAAEKKDAKKRAEAKRKSDAARRDFIQWAKPQGKLIGRILRAAKPEGDTGEFITDLASKLRKHWKLTERQMAAAVKVLDAREDRKRQDASSNHVGNIKDRIDFEGAVEFVMQRAGYYGITTILKFRGDDGNVYTWFASGLQDLAKGDRVKVRGTIKKHDEYQGVKQTVLSRCVVEKVATIDENPHFGTPMDQENDINLGNRVTLVYPERRTVPASQIFSWHSDAVANGEVEAHTADLHQAIADLSDIGHITVAA